MTLRIIAFIAVLILPFKGPKKRKVTSQGGISDLAINENGYMEYFTGRSKDHEPVQ